MSQIAASKVAGPFNVIAYGGLEGTTILELPFQEVAGCQLAARVTDNFATFAVLEPAAGGLRDARFFAAAELGLWGRVQGEEHLILRDYIAQQSGPLVYTFSTWESYEAIVLKARNISGGVAGGSYRAYPPSTAIASDPAQVNGAFLKVQVFIQPTSGVGFNPPVPPPGYDRRPL